MKEYPLDRWAEFVVWPMDLAQRTRNRAVKLLLAVFYLAWFAAVIPVTAVLLGVSIAMMVWDEVNGN